MDELIRKWEEAERRLYPSMVAQPEVVAGSMQLVRAVADDLGSVHSQEELAEAWGRATELAESAARGLGMKTEAAADLELVAGAAFALRHRELMAEATWSATRRRIDQARPLGDEWVVLSEAGVPEAPFPQPYSRVEMRLADGFAIHTAAELDPDSEGIVYSVEGLRLDPTTGELAGPAGPPRREFADHEEWLREVQALHAASADDAG
jgi:hypothetical protein